MSHDESVPMRTRWARLRFSIIGPLLAALGEHGELATRIGELAERRWQHPTNGEAIRFGVSTIERWYYLAKDAADPLTALARKVPAHAGTHPRVSARLAVALAEQHTQHPRWSFQLHHDNLVALARQDPTLGRVPSYTTLCRYMKDRGLTRSRRRKRRDEALAGLEAREMRAFEVSHVQALWHLDFHEGSRKVLTAAGEWQTPRLLGILDDHSRLCCHLQWYLDETAATLIHGLAQALQKRGLPRALLTDNGSAMVAAETTEGLERLGILARNTLPYTPEQNAKQEVFWAQVEGRLMAMLEGEPELTLPLLNQATQAWVELEYHRRKHSEIGEPPLERYLRGPSVSRPCPDSETLRRAFRTEVTRAQRRSDGTCTVEGVRFELPARYRTLTRLTLRVARWDLSAVDLVDGRTGAHLARLLPLDKAANADGRRRRLPTAEPTAGPTVAPAGIAAHLRALMAEYAATGLPPAYLPKDPTADPEEDPT
jgi:transposase InsO family protein